MVSCLVTKTPTALQIALSVLIRERHLIEAFYKYGVTCSYDEALRFRGSAAAAASQEISLRGISSNSGGRLVQAIADNFDTNISSQNVLQSTHALALLIAQQNVTEETGRSVIPKLQKKDLKDPVCEDVDVYVYSGPKKPTMPPDGAKQSILPLKVLSRQAISQHKACDLDFAFFKSVTTAPDTPEFYGYNTKLKREAEDQIQPSTRSIFTPLIDMVPSDPTAMLTAMEEASRITKLCGQDIVVFTTDQQLYRVAINITWVYPERFSNFIPRLGGMHFLLSFVSSVGTLMSETGLEDVLKCAFGSVSAMLNGKKFPQNVRALRILTEEILRRLLSTAQSKEELMTELESRAIRSKTVKLWVDCLIKPVFLMMLYIRAEREADWALHLYAVKQILPYFYAANHINYARYGLYYYRSMHHLPPDILSKFLDGQHVMRHKPGLWNGIWSDMWIETTYMRYGKGLGGIKGITLKPSTLKKWALGHHICSQIAKDVTELTGTDMKNVIEHKEEKPGRIKSDTEDRVKIRNKLVLCIDPLDPSNHPGKAIVNIVTGRVGPDLVNVHNAVQMGQQLMGKYEASWPHGFYNPLSSKVVTMNIINRKIKIDQKTSFDTELIYNRMMGLRGSRELSLKNVFSFELAPIPTSMFDEDGNMYICKAKSDLKRRLQMEIPVRTAGTPEVVIIDGCAILWHVNWPSSGTVLQYCQAVSSHVQKKLQHSDVFLVFDRYFDYSIKSGTRTSRGKQASRHHLLQLSSPLPPQDAILNVYQNKVQLIKLICQVTVEDCIQLKLQRLLVVTGPDYTPIEVFDGNSCSRDDLKTTHEEADVIMVQQMLNLAFAGASRIRVVSDDTDVFILLLHFYHSYRLSCHLSMESTSSCNRSVIDIGATVTQHEDIMHSLLACHAISGCDTVAKLSGIGKATALRVLKSGNSLHNLGKTESTFDDVVKEATAFISPCYGIKNKHLVNMSEIRFHVWSVKVGKHTAVSPKLQSLPPTTESFLENLKRAHLQLAIWYSVDSPHPPVLNPEEYGWIRDEPSKCLLPILFPSGKAAAPDELLKMIRCGCESAQPCATRRCSCASAHLPCTIFCGCKDSVCQNALTTKLTIDENNDDHDDANGV